MARKRARRRGRRRKEPGDAFKDKRLIEARKRVVGILKTIAAQAKNAELMQACGTWPAAIKIGPDGCMAVYRNQCRQRLCPVCATLKAGRHRMALFGVIEERKKKGARFTLMTLTLRHGQSDEIKESLDILSKALTLFRNTSFFRKHIWGWARGIEVTWSPKNGFHPHAHWIIEAGFMDIDQLYSTWDSCVRKAGGRPITREGVDVKGLPEGKGLNEAIGYPFKVQGLAEWPSEKIVELMSAVKGRRLYQACQRWSRRIEEREAEAEAFENLDGASRVVLFKAFLEDVRTGDFDSCHAVPSVVAMLRAIGWEQYAETVLDVLPRPASLRRTLAEPVP